MVLLAHIREQHHLSLGSYGRPRITEELKEIGLRVGHRSVGRLKLKSSLRILIMFREQGNHTQLLARHLPAAGWNNYGQETS